jgi:hypothetical protein
MMKWLEDHPITLDDDVAFLKHEVENRKRAAMKATKDSKKKISNLLKLMEQQRSIKKEVDDILTSG